jgi:hypothetical protein
VAEHKGLTDYKFDCLMQSPSTIIDYGVVSETMDVELDVESDVNGAKEVRIQPFPVRQSC